MYIIPIVIISIITNLCRRAEPCTPSHGGLGASGPLWTVAVSILTGMVEDGETDDWETLCSGGRVLDGKKSLFWARLARAAKNHFGLLPCTEANKAMVWRWMAAKLKTKNLRDSEICRMVPMARALAFFPTEADISASQLIAALAARRW